MRKADEQEIDEKGKNKENARKIFLTS